MRRGLAVAALLITLSGTGRAAESELTSARWPSLPIDFKMAFVHGWVEAVNTLHNLTKVDANVMQFLWPKGHRVGSVVLELDAECKKSENRKMPYSDMLALISYTLNQTSASK